VNKDREKRIERFVATTPTITGAASILLGLPLIVRPAIGASVGLGADQRLARVGGIVDCTVGCGLLSGRANGRWMTARLLANVPFVALCARTIATDPQRRGRAIGLLGMLSALSVVDGFVAWRLTRARD
jgi:hypothetical protein